jgi:16S rRNA (uracil1498-N3)-methyltransferase
MRVSRIFTRQVLTSGATVNLEQRATRYLSQVLRLRSGDKIVLFDGSGGDFQAELTRCDRKACTARVAGLTRQEHPTELQLHLGVGVSRGERMDFVIQKSVELGVAAITPLLTERSLVQFRSERQEKRMAHWQGVLLSACEQSGRSLIPSLHSPAALPDWFVAHHDGLMLDHRVTRTLPDLPHPGTSLTLLVGPEGGLSQKERSRATAAGFTAVRLGPRVLRTETAPLAALAAIQVLWGDLR